jgi:hypothetical protein
MRTRLKATRARSHPAIYCHVQPAQVETSQLHCHNISDLKFRVDVAQKCRLSRCPSGHYEGRVARLPYIPAATHKREDAAAVGRYTEAITDRPPAVSIEDAHRLWTGMLSTKDYPADQEVLKLVAYFQFPHIRDRLMADIPGIDEPPERILFAQTNAQPEWSRIEWAQDLLLHTYIRTSPQHAAPILTAIGYINWWEGRGSKAHQYLQLALDTDPGYRFARLTDHMLGAGIIAGWNTNKNTAYKNNLEMP